MPRTDVGRCSNGPPAQPRAMQCRLKRNAGKLSNRGCRVSKLELPLSISRRFDRREGNRAIG